jgi:hypothetical protein
MRWQDSWNSLRTATFSRGVSVGRLVGFPPLALSYREARLAVVVAKNPCAN